MFNRFRSRRRAMLGVDVSPASIKILEVSENNQHFQVQAYASDWIDEHLMNPSDLSSKIEQLLNNNNFSTRQAAIALADASVMTKVIPVPKNLCEKAMEEWVSIEAEQCIPATEAINLDFKVQGPSLDNPDMLDVLIVAARAHTLNKQIDIFKQAGLDVKVVDIESCAIARVFQQQAIKTEQESHKIIAVIDMGVMYTRIIVMQGTTIIFTREDDFGSHQFIKKMETYYGFSREKILHREIQTTALPDYEENMANPFKKEVISLVNRILQLFYSTSFYGLVDCLVLAGGMAGEKGLIESVQAAIGVPVMLANPFLHLPIVESMDSQQLEIQAPSLLTACGLALRCHA